MKKIIAIFILSFMILTLLVSCQSSAKSSNANKNKHNNRNDTSSTDTNNTEQNGQEDERTQNIVPMPPEYIGGGETNEFPPENSEIPEDGEVVPGGEQTGEGSGAGESTTPGESGGVVTPEYVVGNQVGNLFLDQTLAKIDGGYVNTADYRGKIVIINIWATWCPPCKAELPDFDRIASEYSDDVVIIAAHTPSGSASAQSYVNTNFPETHIIFAYDTAYGDAYYAAGGDEYVPQTAILDKNGVIIYADSGMMTYEQVVAIIDNYL